MPTECAINRTLEKWQCASTKVNGGIPFECGGAQAETGSQPKDVKYHHQEIVSIQTGQHKQ